MLHVLLNQPLANATSRLPGAIGLGAASRVNWIECREAGSLPFMKAVWTLISRNFTSNLLHATLKHKQLLDMLAVGSSTKAKDDTDHAQRKI